MADFPKDLNNKKAYPSMVSWFSPSVLLKTANKVITSTIFGNYADRRLVHASLNVVDPEKVIEQCCGGEKGLYGESGKSPVWVDYVADLGDGFDSTYAIAYLIGQKSIKVGNNTELPRADCLVMGGDTVYPDASRYDYETRMQQPYKQAFPRNGNDPSRPPVYLIPGNHDWYDGLTLFLAKFCKGQKVSLGNWIASQGRSYFAVHLSKNWWIWGFDSQLGEDIDIPQADYFKTVAEKMEPGAKVILCASVPSWLKASTTSENEEERERYYRSLDYIANLVRNGCKGSKIPLVISGDLHHYSRFIAKEAGTNFITAGGGGAFLHPTHHLPDHIETIWARSNQTLKIAENSSIKDKDKRVFYPPKSKSRKLALGNWKFFLQNWDFSLVIGFAYWLGALLLLVLSGSYGEAETAATFSGKVLDRFWDITLTPLFLILFFAVPLLMYWTADIQSKFNRATAVIIHSLLHLVVLLFGTAIISVLFAGLISIPFGEIIYFIVLGIGMGLLGFVGGLIWGLYLTFVCYRWGAYANDAFAAMKLDSYKHFLRLKIEDDKLTIYPVGIDKSPERKDWDVNKNYQNGNQNEPFIVPNKELGQHLIEKPVVIDLNNILPLKEID